MKKGLRFRRFFLAVAGTLFIFSVSSCSSLFYYPDRILHAPPANFGFAPEELWFSASDGTKLFGWWFKSTAKTPKGTIIQFHGNGENMSSHYLSLVWLTRQGYNLFVFDYRGYGKSEGETTTHEGAHLDSLAALQTAWKRHQEQVPKGLFVVYGQSIGGIIGMRASHDSDLRGSIDLIVMDSSFSSFKEIAREKAQEFWLTWIISPLVGFFVSDNYAVEKVLGESRTLLLVIHSKDDPIIPIDFGEDTFRRSQSHTLFWKIDVPGHVSIFESPEWREKFVRLLESVATARKR